MAAEADAPTILFGAFDRHNFGDLLFPHIAAALLPDANPIYAGLAERDLRPFGGHRVQAITKLVREMGDSPVRLVHAGGELLTCDAWQAAVMLTPAEEVQHIICSHDDKPMERLEWAQARLGMPDLAPYVHTRRLFPHAASIVFNAVGGVDLDEREPALRAEVLSKLKAADAVSVRDSRTLSQLENAGVGARLTPDPAVMVAELFGEKILQHGEGGEPAATREAFPQGYLAVQFSADFGDDATLAQLASQLDQAAVESGLGIVLFRAGAAPWHDDLSVHERLASRMHAAVRVFRSLHLWDICALIAASRGFCGSSLHGRIVAAAFALPQLSLLPPDHSGKLTKQAAYAETWNGPCHPAMTSAGMMAEDIRSMLAADSAGMAAWAREMAARYRQAFDELLAR